MDIWKVEWISKNSPKNYSQEARAYEVDNTKRSHPNIVEFNLKLQRHWVKHRTDVTTHPDSFTQSVTYLTQEGSTWIYFLPICGSDHQLPVRSLVTQPQELQVALFQMWGDGGEGEHSKDSWQCRSKQSRTRYAETLINKHSHSGNHYVVNVTTKSMYTKKNCPNVMSQPRV